MKSRLKTALSLVKLIFSFLSWCFLSKCFFLYYCGSPGEISVVFYFNFLSIDKWREKTDMSRILAGLMFTLCFECILND